MMKRCIGVFLAIACAFGLAACKDKGVGENPTGELRFSAKNTKDGYDPSAVMDGSLTTGWICSKKATESNFQVFDIDFGEVKTFTTITLDDSMTAGYTNRKPEYIAQTATYQNGNASSVGEGTLAAVVSGAADGQSWKSDAIPTAEAPQWIWLSLANDVDVKKIELNNEMNNSVLVSYEVYYSAEAHDRRNEAEYTDVESYVLLDKKTDNAENIIEIESEESIRVRDLFIKVFSQQNEGVDVVASLDEVLLYGETPDDYFENHQPEKFTIMGSVTGTEFDILVEVNGNYDTVWTYTLAEAVSYRYIRYVVFAEYNNNYPSIGEISFK